MSFKQMLENQKEVFELIPTKYNKDIAQATYVPYSDASKIYALEGILNQASDVFGPYGGIYTELYTNNHTKQIMMVKSKDGHRFFESLDFIDTYALNTLCNIREKTLYVSGSKGKTSRDGTTSLALVSSALSSDVLTNRLVNRQKYIVPSFIISATLETISAEFRKLVDARKKLVYIPGEGYVEGGFDAALNAIATTVDRNYMFVNAYKKLMEECIEQGIDITESSVTTIPERSTTEDGNSNFELKLDAGLRMAGSAFEQNKVYSLKDEKAPIFILDGFSGDELNNIFVPEFKKWMKDLLLVMDENNVPLFSAHNPNGLKPPVFFYNRSTDGVKQLFEEMEKYVTIKIKLGTGETVEETIKPKFIFLQSEDISKESYTDFLEIFKESVIPLNGMRRHMLEVSRSFLTEEEIAVQGTVPYSNQVAKARSKFTSKEEVLFYNVEAKTLSFKMNNYKYDRDRDEIKENTIDNITVENRNLRELVATVSFDGSTVYVKSDSDKHNTRITGKRESIKENLKGYSIHSAEYEAAKELLNMYNTATITPKFYVKTEDEYGILVDLFQDAQGIFQSVHIHGVLSGGNTTMLKVWEQLKENTLNTINEQFSASEGLSEINRDKYVTFTEAILESVYRAYYRVYKILTQEEDETVLDKCEKYATIYKDDPTISYDLILGTFNHKALESTRTTVDTFQAALDVLSDMLNIKRVRIQKESEAIAMTTDFVDGSEVKVSRDMTLYYNNLMKK